MNTNFRTVFYGYSKKSGIMLHMLNKIWECTSCVHNAIYGRKFQFYIQFFSKNSNIAHWYNRMRMEQFVSRNRDFSQFKVS